MCKKDLIIIDHTSVADCSNKWSKIKICIKIGIKRKEYKNSFLIQSKLGVESFV